jgi:hypothetical protein
MRVIASGRLQPPPHGPLCDLQLLGDEPDMITLEFAALAKLEKARHRRLAKVRTGVPLPAATCRCHGRPSGPA